MCWDNQTFTKKPLYWRKKAYIWWHKLKTNLFGDVIYYHLFSGRSFRLRQERRGGHHPKPTPLTPLLHVLYIKKKAFMTVVPIIKKPVHWFVLQINGLVSIWDNQYHERVTKGYLVLGWLCFYYSAMTISTHVFNKHFMESALLKAVQIFSVFSTTFPKCHLL